MTNNSRPRINPEMLVGVSAVVIGVCALAVSLYETSLMRKEQRAAVMPLMELGRSYSLGGSEAFNDKWRLSLHALNVGIGPARVVDFLVTVDGVARPTWQSAMQALLRKDVTIQYGQSTINGRTIAAGAEITMFNLDDTRYTADIVAEFGRLDFEACYCSVFDECWIASYSALGTVTPVERCQRSDKSFEEQGPLRGSVGQLGMPTIKNQQKRRQMR